MESSFLSSMRRTGISVSGFCHSTAPYMLLYCSCQTLQDSCSTLLAVPGISQWIPLTVCQTEQIICHDLHQNNFLEIIFVLSGEICHQIEETYYKYTSGDCCMLSRSIRHSQKFSVGSEAFFLILSREFLANLMEHDARYDAKYSCGGGFRTLRRLMKQEQRDPFCPDKKYALYSPLHQETEASTPSVCLREFYTLFRRMLEETRFQKPGSMAMMEVLVTRFFSLLEASGDYRKSLISLTCSKEELLVNKISHIFEACHGNIGRDELALVMNYNSDYLNRIVKRRTGMSLMSYGQLFCLKEAERLLLESSKSIAEIVSGLGFSNRSYFYRVFEKKYGMTPKEYRKMHNIYF